MFEEPVELEPSDGGLELRQFKLDFSVSELEELTGVS